MEIVRCKKAQRRLAGFCFAALAGSIFVLAAWAGSNLGAGEAPGALRLSVVDGATKQTTPARIEVLDKDGKAYIADDALLIGGD